MARRRILRGRGYYRTLDRVANVAELVPLAAGVHSGLRARLTFEPISLKIQALWD